MSHSICLREFLLMLPNFTLKAAMDVNEDVFHLQPQREPRALLPHLQQGSVPAALPPPQQEGTAVCASTLEPKCIRV
eukprot:7428631-Heterocapsa_arctica.AAC.1